MIYNSRSGGDEDDRKIEEDVPVYVVFLICIRIRCPILDYL